MRPAAMITVWRGRTASTSMVTTLTSTMALGGAASDSACEACPPAAGSREQNVKAIKLRVRRLMGVDSFPAKTRYLHDTDEAYQKCTRNVPTASCARVPFAL